MFPLVSFFCEIFSVVCFAIFVLGQHVLKETSASVCVHNSRSLTLHSGKGKQQESSPKPAAAKPAEQAKASPAAAKPAEPKASPAAQKPAEPKAAAAASPAQKPADTKAAPQKQPSPAAKAEAKAPAQKPADTKAAAQKPADTKAGQKPAPTKAAAPAKTTAASVPKPEGALKKQKAAGKKPPVKREQKDFVWPVVISSNVPNDTLVSTMLPRRKIFACKELLDPLDLSMFLTNQNWPSFLE